MTPAEIVLAAIMLFNHSPARACLIQRQAQIAEILQVSQQAYPEMPMTMLATIGYMETYLGCAANEGGNWGAPIDPQHRHTAGTPLHAARALWRSYEVCNHDWEAAARRFRTGLCHSTPVGTHYGQNALRTRHRLMTMVQRNREYALRVCDYSSSIPASF